jgi:hypothetical protein
MTDRERAIVSAYTGYAMLCHDKWHIYLEYVEKILGRPIWTHELAMRDVQNEIHEKSKDDFISLCKGE